MRRKNTTKQMMKEYISESLLLLMENKKYIDISIAEITAKAGVNRSTYYRNFPSKEDIVKFYLSEIMHNYLMEYQNLTDKSLETYLFTIFKHFYIYKSELLLIYKNNLSYLILEVLNSFLKENQIDNLKNTNNEFQIFYHIGGIYNFFILWFSHDMRESPIELSKIAVDIFPPDTKPMLFPVGI